MSELAASSGDDSTRCAIGMDVGGTKVAGGLVRHDGQIVAHRAIPTLHRRGGEAVLRDVYRLAEQLLDGARNASYTPVGIGLSLCELVDNQGRILSEQTIPWAQLDIRDRLSKLAPTVVEADCRAAALCEARFGAGRDFPIFLYVTIGTGISCSLVMEGRPYLGARGLTGTMASGVMTTLCSECGEVSTSIVEQIASGPAIAARYNHASGGEVDGSEAVLDAAHEGDATAREIVVSAATCLGSTIAQLVSVLDPHAVVIGGGLGSASGLYWQTLQTSIRKHIWSEAQRALPIVQGTYGNLAALAGAAAVALRAFA